MMNVYRWHNTLIAAPNYSAARDLLLEQYTHAEVDGASIARQQFCFQVQTNGEISATVDPNRPDVVASYWSKPQIIFEGA